MKSYKHLFDICISEANRRRAIQQAKRTKRVRKMIKKRHMSDDELLEKSLEWILNYENAKHTPVRIQDGTSRKERWILVPTLEELIVQHCICKAMEEMFWRGMYEHSYASLPNRGAHKAKKRIEKWIDTDPKNVKYVLKMDIHHFFDSIPHDILKAKLAKKIHDDRMLDLLFKIIDVTDVGIPLGFYTSQWLSNWFLQDLDHYIKEQLHAVYYVRYMDDMVIFGSNKKVLHQIRLGISQYLEAELGLELKGNWQVFRFSYTEKVTVHDKKGDHVIEVDRGRDLDFMGFRFYRKRTTLRRSIMLKATRKARKIHKKPKPTVYDYRQMMSYLGWIDATDVYKMYLRHIKPRVNFKRMKRYISRYDIHDDKRVYERLIKLYLPKGGKVQNGPRLHNSRERGETARARSRRYHRLLPAQLSTGGTPDTHGRRGAGADLDLRGSNPQQGRGVAVPR